MMQLLVVRLPLAILAMKSEWTIFSEEQ